jgi:hypothetical protein
MRRTMLLLLSLRFPSVRRSAMPAGRESLAAAALIALLSSCVAHKERGGLERDASAPAEAIALPSAPPATGPRQQPAAQPQRQDAAAAAVTPPMKSAATGPLVPASLDRLTRDPFTPDLRAPGRIEIGRIAVSGGLVANPERTVMRMKNGFRGCIAEGEGGTITLDVLVAENGSVLSAKATDVAGLGPSATGCIERRAQAATFKPPVGGQANVLIPVSAGSSPEGD